MMIRRNGDVLGRLLGIWQAAFLCVATVNKPSTDSPDQVRNFRTWHLTDRHRIGRQVWQANG